MKKVTAIIVLAGVGMAFLAVSAWVFFSRGENAKAIRAKYRLGGIMLTFLTMLSAASCGDGGDGIGPFVTCYDPVVSERTDNLVSLDIKRRDTSYRYNEISPGDTVSVLIRVPTYKQYVLRVILNNTAGTELQRAKLVVPEAAEASFEMPLSQSVTHRGEALLEVRGILQESPEELSEMSYANMVINIR